MDGISCDSSGIGVNTEAPELSNQGILSCAMLDAVQSFASRVYHAFCCCSLLGGQRLRPRPRRTGARTWVYVGRDERTGQNELSHSELSVASATLPDVKSSSHCRWTSKLWGALPDSHP